MYPTFVDGITKLQIKKILQVFWENGFITDL
jgi:hypothetical protein